MGMGPSRIDAEGQMLHNEYSWNSNASLIFLDQPVNTGFSYSNKRINNTITAAQDVYRFLAQFFEKYPQYGKQDLHIAGEGYAGRFIPVLAAEIANREEDNLVHLKSVMIGNGIVDPYTQYPKYLPMGCGKGGHAAIYKPRTCRRFSKIVKICQTWIRHCYIHGHSSCINAAAYCDAVIIGGFARRSRTNIRDIRRPCDGGTACYAELGHIKSWLNRPDVMRALGANADAFELCSAKVEREFRTSGDGFMPYYRYVPGVLDETPVLVYAGDKDYMANWLGSEAWTHALDWAGHDDFNKSNSTEMREMQSGEVYGTLKHARGLAFLRVYDAGHIVPLDRPRSALDFVNRWLRLPGFEELGPS
jgi:cathepsin A (carboxypeptidase C)